MTAQHQVVKSQKLVATAVGMLEQELIIPSLFQKESFDAYKGAENDTVNMKVEGILPFREYEFRAGSAGSSSPGTRPALQMDEYVERKIAVTLSGNFYNGVYLTDEQNDFDIDQWGTLLRPQVKAVARGLARGAVNTLTSHTYNVTVGNAEANLRAALIEARRVLNKFNAPGDRRYLLVGTDFEGALLNDEKLNLAQNVGDAEAVSALQNATIGRRFGFDIIVDQTIPGHAAYAFADSGFVMANASPAVPQSVPYGATQSFEGIALRWLRDYESMRLRDRSVVNTYAGFRAVDDVLVGWDETDKSEVVSEGEHFVRGIKMDLNPETSVYPEVGTELAEITGIDAENKWAVNDTATEPA